MRVSLNTIKQHTDVDLSVEELVAKINAQLGGVEEVIDLGKRYENIVIVKVVECEPLENSDHLHKCLIDDGGAIEWAERTDAGFVQVLTGAPNVHKDMIAVWLPPRATVPASYDEKELFVLSSRPLRGEMSHGMLASAKELAIGDSHEGLLDILETDLPTGYDLQGIIGKPFAEIFGLDDTIIEIENKMFTHRPDLFGQLGVAREIAGIQHKQFTSPSWYINEPTFQSGNGLAMEFANEAPEKVPRFMGVVVKAIEVKPSPLWLQTQLVCLGGKPINNIVDVTNYIMLLTAQPTHAYDYDKLRGNKLVARMAHTGETVTLLNDKTYELNETDIVIADGEGPVGLAGIMGGGESEVDENTKNIVLEVATFDMYTLRKSSMRHGVFTDALTRFNKGQSPRQNAHVLHLLLDSIFDVGGGEQASDVFDAVDEEIQLAASEAVTVTPRFVNELLGLDLSADEIKQLLKNVELDSEDEINVVPSFWRTDLELPEDIVEEVGRLYGYDRLPRELPQRSTKPAAKNAYRELAKITRDTLARAGANELLTYSFVHKNVIERAGQDAKHAYQIANALSPDLQYYRLSLTPSLLDKIHGNVKAGYSEFALFEIGKVHSKQLELDQDGLPREQKQIALSVVSKKQKPESAYYQAKVLLEYLTSKLGIALRYEPLSDALSQTLTAPFEPKRSAIVRDASTGDVLGVIGEYTSGTKQAFKLPDYAAGFELFTDELLKNWVAGSSYVPLSKYPSTDRDVTFKVDASVNYSDIVDLLGHDDEAVMVRVSPVGIYQAEGEPTKNVTVHLTLAPQDKTLSGDEANTIVDTLTSAVVGSVGAEIV